MSDCVCVCVLNVAKSCDRHLQQLSFSSRTEREKKTASMCLSLTFQCVAAGGELEENVTQRLIQAG